MDNAINEAAQHQIAAWTLSDSLKLWGKGSVPYDYTKELIRMHQSVISNYSEEIPIGIIVKRAEELKKNGKLYGR